MVGSVLSGGTGLFASAAFSAQAVFATAHKLLRVIHSVLKNRKLCVDPGTDCQEIIVRRSAPRRTRMMKACGIEPPAAGQAATQPP